MTLVFSPLPDLLFSAGGGFSGKACERPYKFRIFAGHKVWLGPAVPR
jgi:hypothetical protein